MRVPAPEAVNAVDAAASTERLLVKLFAADIAAVALPLTERCRVNAFAAETAAEAEPSKTFSLMATLEAVTSSEAVANNRAINAALAEIEAATVTLASTN